jgi:hypothetical protein
MRIESTDITRENNIFSYANSYLTNQPAYWSESWRAQAHTGELAQWWQAYFISHIAHPRRLFPGPLFTIYN